MNVLSLFDGMSGGQLALNKLGIIPDKYYASEIDKYAIKITQKNFPNTIQLGNVENITGDDLNIDLLIAGSPCQGFSIANRSRLNFDDPRSKLFFEFVRLLKKLKPKYFLLENVSMKKEWIEIINDQCGVEGYMINSSNFSAQNRKRYYWTNIPFDKNIQDKGIILKDILEEYRSDPPGALDLMTDKNAKAYCLTASYEYAVYWNSINKYQRTMIPTNKPIQVGMAKNIKGHDILRRIYSPEGKSPTLNTCSGGNREPKVSVNEINWRKLTPIECERLQTVPDNYTEGVSKTQRYKMLGNGWNVDTVAHIFSGLPNPN